MKTIQELENGMDLLNASITRTNELIELKVAKSIHFATVEFVGLEIDVNNETETVVFGLETGDTFKVLATSTNFEWIATIIIRFLITGESSKYIIEVA